MGIRLLVASLCIVLMIGKATSDELRVLAAGSLREVLGEIGKHYEQATGTPVVADFGPSGLLRERIEKGEHADLFASADMGHPLKLLRDGRATRVAMFTRNTLCAVAVPQIQLTTANFLDRLLDPAIKLGTSTPRADPAGDYTWAMFRRADAIRPGAYEILDKKAQQIVGGPANNAPVDGKDPAIVALAAGRVDIVIGYCTSAKLRLANGRTAGRDGAVRGGHGAGIRLGTAQRFRSARAGFGALHAVARRAADVFPLWLLAGSPAGFRTLSAARIFQSRGLDGR
jgi:ABC-type molybdate transport system substrate-binding protein